MIRVIHPIGLIVSWMEAFVEKQGCKINRLFEAERCVVEFSEPPMPIEPQM
jgi:hypothetical protein